MTVKAQLRQELRAAERALSAAERADADRKIMALLLAMPEYRAARSVFCFVSMPREIQTAPLLRDALAQGKTLCVPRCLPERQMSLSVIRSLDELRPGYCGIPEPPEDAPALSPEALDLAVIPCAGCSLTGDRLGRGGGYYDRFFARYNGVSVLLCRSALTRADIPMEAHDRRVPLVVTEHGVYENGVLRPYH